MSVNRPGLIGLGIALGAAGVAGATGLVIDQIRRNQDALLEQSDSLVVVPSRELVVVTTDGVPLHVEIDEPSPRVPARELTVVLSHGFCLSLRCWVYQRRALAAAGYRVVTWDQRGHGKSAKGAREANTTQQLGLDLRAVVAAAAPTGPLALVGHSMGGMTVMALAEVAPELVRDRVRAVGFVATSPGGIPLANGGVAAAFGKVLLERVGPRLFAQLVGRPELLAALLRANRDLGEFLVERYSFASPVPRQVVRLAASMLLYNDLNVILDFVPGLDVHDQAHNLAAFGDCEVLVFNGTDDVLTPPEHSEAIVAAIPTAEHVVIRDAGHVIMLEYPDLLDALLLGLLERAVKPAGAEPAVRVRQTVTPISKPKVLAERRARAARRAARPAKRAVRGSGERPGG